MTFQFKYIIVLFFLFLYSCESRNRPIWIFQHQIQSVKDLASCIAENDSIFSKNLPLNMTVYLSKCSDVQCLCASEYENLKDFSEVTITEKTIIFRIKRESGYEEAFYHDLVFLRKDGEPPIAKKWDGHTETKIKKIDSNLYYQIYHRLGDY